MAGKISPRLLAAGLGCALVSLNINTVWASGFAIREQSSTAQGNAFAGATAGAEDISYMFFNPAGLTYHKDSEVLGVASYIIPTSQADDAEATTADGDVIQGSNNSGEIAEDALVPALYAMWAATPELRFGLGVNAPFGLVTDNDEDYVGRYHGTRSELETININPVVAYRALDWLSLGAGLQVQYAETQLQNAVDFGTIGGVGTGGVFATDGAANLRGDDVAFGYNAGIMIDTWEGARVGLAYRSEINHDIEGNVDFDGDSLGVASGLQSAGFFVASDAQADLTTPATASVGIYQDINEEWAIMGELAWTDWSEFNELRIEFDEGGQGDAVTVEDWEDSLFVAIGATYRPKAIEGLALRLGLAYDQTPIPDDTRTPRVPGNDRYWVSIGAGYKPFDWAEVTLSYTHIFMQDGNVNLTVEDDPNNATRGNLKASYEQHIDIVTLSGRIIF